MQELDNASVIIFILRQAVLVWHNKDKKLKPIKPIFTKEKGVFTMMQDETETRATFVIVPDEVRQHIASYLDTQRNLH